MLLSLLLAIVASDDLPKGTSAATRELFAAVESGDAAAVKRAVAKKGVDLDAHTQHEGDTALMIAANQANLVVLKVLLAAGADPNVTPHTRYHHGPLFYALMGSKWSAGSQKTVEQINAIVSALLAAKADPNLEMVMSEGSPTTTPTLVAATLMPETLALFLAAKGDPNRVQSDGRDALQLAAESEDEETGLQKLDLLLKGGARVPADEKGRAKLLARAFDQGNAAAAHRLLDAGCTTSPTFALAPALAAGAARSGDAALFETFMKGLACPGAFTDRGLIGLALAGLQDADAAKRERVLALARRLQACGASTEGALSAAASANDAAAFAWAEPLEPGPLKPNNRGYTALHYAAISGADGLVPKLLARGAVAETEPTPLSLAAKHARAKVLEVLWPKASTTAREHALATAADSACDSRADVARAVETFAALGRLGVEQAPDPVRGCRPEAWVAFHSARQKLEAAGEGTREFDALVFGGDAKSAEAWEAGAKALLEKSSDWVVLLGAYPRRVRSDTVSGMNPGFDVVLLGLCAPEQSASRLEALKALYPGVYVKRVSAKAREVGCPLVMEQPVVAATKSAKAGGETLTLSILRRGRQRTCVAAKVDAAGGLTGFAREPLPADGCSAYDEGVDVTAAGGECSSTCSGRRTRFKVKAKGPLKLEPVR